jgi:predicted transcriptional regulator
MSKLLEDAISAVRRLPPSMQDEIARAMLVLAGNEDDEVYILTPEERAAIAESEAEVERGEFASDEEVRAVWAKFGL